MAFTLEDLLALPDNVQPEHAERAGLTVPPPPALAPAPQPPPPMAPPTPAPSVTTGPQPQPPEPIIPIDSQKFFKGVSAHPHTLAQSPAVPPTIDAMPGGVGPDAGLGSIQGVDQYTKLPTLNFKQRENLPTFSPGVPVNSEQFFNNKRERLEEKDQNPYGSAENHPGWLGKTAHVAAKIGNIAGDIVDPSLMAALPETDLGRRVQEGQFTEQAQKEAAGELAKEAEAVKERQEDTRELHEENFRQHSLDLERQGQEKIDALVRGLDIKEAGSKEKRVKDLRAFGMKPDPKDPDNPDAVVDIPPEELSPLERQKMLGQQALYHAREAKAAYDKYKADPNSTQAQAILEHAHAATIAAKASAERAGILKDRYFADYLGEDEHGDPLAGAELTDDNRPVGLKVSGAAGKGVTNTTRAMAEMARTVQPQIEKVQNEVQTLSSSLGPAVGRWNDLMTNKGGADFPEFAGLDQDLDLLASAVVRTHFGARGGQGYREALRKNFGEAQSPDDLLARINSASSWIQGYANADQQANKRHVGQTPTATPPPKGGGTAKAATPKQGGQDFGDAPKGSKEGRTGVKNGVPVMIYNGKIVERNP